MECLGSFSFLLLLPSCMQASWGSKIEQKIDEDPEQTIPNSANLYRLTEPAIYESKNTKPSSSHSRQTEKGEASQINLARDCYKSGPQIDSIKSHSNADNSIIILPYIPPNIRLVNGRIIDMGERYTHFLNGQSHIGKRYQTQRGTGLSYNTILFYTIRPNGNMPNTRRGEYDAAVVKKPLDPMRISSLLNDPDVCWQPRETSNIFGRVYTVTPKSTVQSGRTHSKQVQLSDLSHVSTKESGHISNHNGHSRRYSDEELWFIWYKRTVHRQQWDNILVDFNHQFPTRKRHHAETVQAAYYRSINRLRVHLGENISTESIIQHAKVSYSWMDIHSNQVQFSDLSTKESGHNSNHNGYYQRYNDEELWFIWYKRAVLCQHWDDVFVSFNRQFPNRQRDCVNGMRNKLNQEIREKRLPSRSQIQVQAGASHLDKVTSLITCANVSYPWMLEALETTQSSAGSDGMIENVSRLN